MIESLYVGIPHKHVSRLKLDQDQVAKFEKVTGIKHTRRHEGNTYSMICDLIDEMPRILDVPNYLIVITQSPDQLSPCLAVEVHDYLDLPASTVAFDVNHACDGWVLGMHLANSLRGRTMLICADRLRFEPDPIQGLMFSDAVTITQVTNGFNPFKSYTDGSKAGYLSCGLNGEMSMHGPEVFDFVTDKIPKFISQFPAGYDWLVPHQANLSMLKILERRSDYNGHMLYSIEEYGNQSMNSIPTCLAHNEKKIIGKEVLCVGFGAGFTACGIGMHWPTKPITKIVEI